LRDNFATKELDAVNPQLRKFIGVRGGCDPQELRPKGLGAGPPWFKIRNLIKGNPLYFNTIKIRDNPEDFWRHTKKHSGGLRVRAHKHPSLCQYLTR
jgi:hypothetical protein